MQLMIIGKLLNFFNLNSRRGLQNPETIKFEDNTSIIRNNRTWRPSPYPKFNIVKFYKNLMF
jgi:hypothetical protein